MNDILESFIDFTETERERERQTDRQTDRQTETERETDRQTDRQTGRDRDRERDRETERQRQRQRQREREADRQFVCWLVGCLTSQQQASVSQGRICSDNFTYCHTEIDVADQTFYLTQSQYNDTGPTSPSADPITPGAWQGSHWSANF